MAESGVFMETKIMAAVVCVLAAGTLTPFCLAENKEMEIKISIAGDSTVASYKIERLAGWGQVLDKYFKDNVVIKNFALSGRSTKTFREKGDWKKLMDSKPDYILVQFGHNDSHAKTKPEATDAATDYKDNLGKFADEAQAAGAKMIFVTPMHRRTFKNGELADILKPYADAMKDVAKEKGLPCLDLHASSGKLLREQGEEKCKYMANDKGDRTHFSKAGAEKMAELIVEELKKSDSDLKKHLK
jgi:lysophospholipase L1-like esterase